MKDSRLRLVVSAPNSIFAEKNYNSGGVVAEETAKDARTVHIEILHDAAHASVLQLPFATTAKNQSTSGLDRCRPEAQTGAL